MLLERELIYCILHKYTEPARLSSFGTQRAWIGLYNRHGLYGIRDRTVRSAFIFNKD